MLSYFVNWIYILEVKMSLFIVRMHFTLCGMYFARSYDENVLDGFYSTCNIVPYDIPTMKLHTTKLTAIIATYFPPKLHAVSVVLAKVHIRRGVYHQILSGLCEGFPNNLWTLFWWSWVSKEG